MYLNILVQDRSISKRLFHNFIWIYMSELHAYGAECRRARARAFRITVRSRSSRKASANAGDSANSCANDHEWMDEWMNEWGTVLHQQRHGAERRSWRSVMMMRIALYTYIFRCLGTGSKYFKKGCFAIPYGYTWVICMFTVRSADAPKRGPSAEPSALAALGK